MGAGRCSLARRSKATPVACRIVQLCNAGDSAANSQVRASVSNGLPIWMTGGSGLAVGWLALACFGDSPPVFSALTTLGLILGRQPFGLAVLFFVFPLGGGVFHERVKTLPASQGKKRGGRAK